MAGHGERRDAREGRVSLICPIAKCKEKPGACHCEMLTGAILAVIAIFALCHHIATTG